MVWRYRVFKNQHNEYGFIEVLLSLQGHVLGYSGYTNPTSWNMKDLEMELEKMAEALNYPILTEDDLLSGAVLEYKRGSDAKST